MAQLVGAVASMPLLQQLHMSVPLDHVTISVTRETIVAAAQHSEVKLIGLTFDDGEYAAALLPLLRPIAAKQFPAMSVALKVGPGRGTNSLAWFLPLFPFVSCIQVYVGPFAHGYGDAEAIEQWLAPVAANIPHLTKLDYCRVLIQEVPSISDSMQRLLEGVAALTSLKELVVDVELARPESDREHQEGQPANMLPNLGLASEVFMRRLCALTSLTCLKLNSFRSAPLPLLAHACRALTGLRELTVLADVAEPDGVLIDAMSRLHLQTLAVSPAENRREFLQGLIPRLPHLRSVKFYDILRLSESDWGTEIRQLIDGLPACRSRTF